MKSVLIAAAVLLLSLSTLAFGQTSSATVTGTVSDSTNALIPGVTITATNTATNVASTSLTNEAGAYSLPGLQPGTYKLTAQLSGFQIETFTDVQLGNAAQIRLNFTLKVAGVAQSLEVTIPVDTLLAVSSPTIGQVLSEKKVSDLPLVGNNILDLLSILGGIDNIVGTGQGANNVSAFGREGTTLAGISAQNVTTVRDGIMVQDLRWPGGINSATVINPDLVGEIKLIVSPVDAEIGRGNGSVQIQTRSGTNQYRGSAVWTNQNTAFNPNSWLNNRNGVPANWSNTNQGTISYGGPIIKNKTFFYALWDMNFARGRANTYVGVLTPCARNGVFRYFDGWNNGAAGAAPTGGTTPTIAVVDRAGNPVTPTANPNGTAYTGKLNYISVFGPVSFPANGPNADCSNRTITGASWDPFRTQPDTTGLITRNIAFQPTPNDFSTSGGGDGLNVASYRYLRGFRGLDNLFSVGEATGDRKQINVKIDHNFSSKHKGNVNVSYERVNSDDTVAGLPGTWSNQNYHHPVVVTAGFVSTLSPSLVNEAKFGYRLSGTNVIAPWDLPENQAGINAYLPPKVSGFLILPDISGALAICSPITGARPPGNCLGANANGANLTATAQDSTPLWTYGDSLSWTKGKHTMKFGGEVRYASSRSTGSSPGLGFFQNNKSPAVIVGGATAGAGLATSGTSAIANTNPAMTGLQSNDATRARNLLNFLSGSLQSINNQYFLTDPTATAFSDYRNFPLITNTVKQREFDIFVKDDYKIRKSLTLNLGVRYEYYGVPFAANGLTAAPIGGGSAAFGISGRDFSSWMKPGAVAFDSNLLTSLQFVGPDSPNSGKSVYANSWNNFGPALGFAWQVPWFGEGKTTVRGGYQITYQGGGRFSTLEGPLSNPPGKTYPGSFAGDSTNPYLDLTKLSGNIPTPIPGSTKPMSPILITDRSASITIFDPGYSSPYVQNLTLAVTRSIRRNLTADVRYVGTLARRQYNSINLNTSNFLYNGLLTEFDKVRTGGESALLDKMFNGINLCTTTCAAGTYGPVGSTAGGVLQTAALQMRSSSSFNTNLALGNYSAVAGTLNTVNYVKSVGCPAAGATGNCNLPDVASTVRGSVLRNSGLFPENFISTNPQFNNTNYFSNMGSANYHSMQVEVTLRPTHGFSGTANYTFSKDLGLPVTFTNPVDRHPDYSIVNNNHPHLFRTNGNIELPIGPNKLLFGNSSGTLARALENWQMGAVWTASSGAWTSISAQSQLYANGVPDVVSADLLKELLADAHVRWGFPTSAGFSEGRYFDTYDVVNNPNGRWTKVADPQCGLVTSLQNLNGGATPRCTLQALAKVVPAGAAGSIPLNDASGKSYLIVLQNPLPGQRGTLGQNVLRSLPIWRFDTNLSKRFKISETKSVQFRADAFNVLNHPQPAIPIGFLSINTSATPFGQIPTKSGTRTFQGQIRLSF